MFLVKCSWSALLPNVGAAAERMFPRLAEADCYTRFWCPFAREGAGLTLNGCSSTRVP
jgi:hypothetical protein